MNRDAHANTTPIVNFNCLSIEMHAGSRILRCQWFKINNASASSVLLTRNPAASIFEGLQPSMVLLPCTFLVVNQGHLRSIFRSVTLVLRIVAAIPSSKMNAFGVKCQCVFFVLASLAVRPTSLRLALPVALLIYVMVRRKPSLPPILFLT